MKPLAHFAGRAHRGALLPCRSLPPVCSEVAQPAPSRLALPLLGSTWWRLAGLACLGLLPALVSAACGGDPEAGSGGDAYRHQAAPIAIGEPVTDDLSLAEADRTDWKLVSVEAPSKLVLDLAADEADTAVIIAAYDKYGQLLGRSGKRVGGAPAHLEVEARQPGPYFVMIQASEGPPSVYTVTATLSALAVPGKGGSGGGSGRPDF